MTIITAQTPPRMVGYRPLGCEEGEPRHQVIFKDPESPGAHLVLGRLTRGGCSALRMMNDSLPEPPSIKVLTTYSPFS